MNKGARDGVICVMFLCPVLLAIHMYVYIVRVLFDAAIPLHFWKMLFMYYINQAQWVRMGYKA